MRQAGRPIDIADGVNSRHIRTAVRIDWNKATLTMYTGSLQAQVLDVPLHANSHEHFRPLHSMGAFRGLHVHLYPLSHDLGVLHTTADVNRDALLFKRFVQ